MVSESSKIFVSAFKFVGPLFVNPVCDVVPFKIFVMEDCVAYVLLAEAVVRYDEREEVNAYEDNAEDNA